MEADSSHLAAQGHKRPPALLIPLAACLLLAVASSGCRTTYTGPEDWSPKTHSHPPLAVTLAPGDEIAISFLGAPQLNTTQRIRRDGKVTLRLVGEVEAAGKTVLMLQKDLTRLYASQLQLQETSIQVTSSAVVFVSGSVMVPGRIDMTRAVTALEAIMEAGGFDETQASVEDVVVIRHSNGRRRGFRLNFRETLEGDGGYPFYLEPYDIVYVSRTTIAKVNQWVEQHINRMLPRLGIGYSTSGDVTVAR